MDIDHLSTRVNVGVEMNCLIGGLGPLYQRLKLCPASALQVR
jgi:hypothetical protein